MKRVLSASVILVVILCAVSGCGKPPAPSTPQISPTQQPSPDPLAEFKKIIMTYADTNKVINMTFDVTKTESLVTPLLGTISYAYAVDSPYYNYIVSKNGLGERDALHWHLTFAYQEKTWVLKRVCLVINNGPPICDDERKDWADALSGERAHWEAQK